MNETAPTLARRMAVARSLADRAYILEGELKIPLFLSVAELATLTGLSEPTLRRLEASGEFPRLVHIGPRRRGVALRNYLQWAERCHSACSTPDNRGGEV
jgi:predicted DNA-binding transcriptional regulator AlpA